MKIDLYEKRMKSAGMGRKLTQKDIADTLGMSRTWYVLYEQGLYEINANQYYKLHSAYPEIFTLPEDFENYTAKMLQLNIKYSGKTQGEVAPLLNIKQPRLSQILKMDEEYYLYDFKDKLEEFFTPYIIKKEDEVECPI